MSTSTIFKKLSITTAGAACIALGTVGSAQATTIVTGSIDHSNSGWYGTTEVDYWNFRVNTAGTVTMNVLAWNFDFGNGPSSLDSYLRLFNDDGSLDVSDYITGNDDSWWSSAASSDGSTSSLDSYLSRFLQVGNYTLAISDFYLSVGEAVAGFQTGNYMGSGSGDYQLTFTGDVTVADAESVPEPASILGLLTVGTLGASSIFKGRKKQAA